MRNLQTDPNAQPAPSPSCPDWCDSPTSDGNDWDTGQLVRSHDIIGATKPTPREGGYHSVQVAGFANEYVDGTPLEFGINVTALSVNLTVEQAQEVIDSLTGLVERIQFLQYKIKRDSKSDRKKRQL